jgi:hypothetical protein
MKKVSLRSEWKPQRKLGVLHLLGDSPVLNLENIGKHPADVNYSPV